MGCWGFLIERGGERHLLVSLIVSRDAFSLGYTALRGTDRQRAMVVDSGRVSASENPAQTGNLFASLLWDC